MLTLTATDAYDNNAQTVVTIYLPEKNDAPVFEEIAYVANYNLDATGASIGLEQDITISNRDDLSLIKITLNCKYTSAVHDSSIYLIFSVQ